MKKVFIFALCVCIFSCAKKNATPVHHVLDIKAGDSISPGVVYVRLHHSIPWLGSYKLQIDVSDTADFLFRIYSQRYDPEIYEDGFAVIPLDQNGPDYIGVDTSNYPLNMNFGENITDSLRWVSGNGKTDYTIYDEYIDGFPNQKNYYSGNWKNRANGYMPFKIVDTKQSKTYKGWVELSQSGGINDYAYVVY